MKLKNSLMLSLTFVTSGVFVGCSSMDETPKSKIEYAPVWEYAAHTQTAISVEKEWWKTFESNQLTQLIEIAREKNPDVIIGRERVRQAELQMKIANASLFPSLSASASSGENRTRVDGGT